MAIPSNQGILGNNRYNVLGWNFELNHFEQLKEWMKLALV